VVTVHNFSYGLVNPALGYLVSCLGAFLGLRCLTRARAHAGRGRAGWLSVAAIAVGACGIWAMHFIAMLGFTIPGQQILYNVPLTLASMVLAVVVVGAGLFIVGYGDGSWPRLVAAGALVGLGVASMHYLGMAAMSMTDNMTYAPVLFVLSVVIAVVAGTAALWIGTWVRGLAATFGASLVMGVAVSGMHYTGMAAMKVTMGKPGMPAMNVSGSSASSLLLPLILGISVVTLLLTLVVSLARTEEEIAEDTLIQQRMGEAAARASIPQATIPRATPSTRRPASFNPAADGGMAASPSAGQPASPPEGRGAGTGAAAAKPPLVTRSPGASGRGAPPPVR
jgi:NO-binding membrane sensor protein with MHYT domain